MTRSGSRPRQPIAAHGLYAVLLGLAVLASPGLTSAARPTPQQLSETIRFAEGRRYPLEFAGRSCAGVDLDGINADEILAMNSSGVLILPNQGDGAFGSTISISMDLDLRAFAVADLDRDGIMDLIGFGMDDSGPLATVRFGTGALGFGPTMRSPLPVNPCDVVAADTDGDGFPEFVLASVEAESLWILASDTLGVLSPAGSVALPYAASSLRAVNLNGDSLLDIGVVHGGTGGPGFGLSLLMNHAGSYDLVQTSLLSEVFDLAALQADAATDSFPDVALISPGAVLLMRGRGDETFEDPDTIATVGTYGQEQMTIRAADIDGDGHTDLIFPSRDPSFYQERNFAGILRGRANGGFAPPQRYVVPNHPELVLVCDLNANLAPDVVLLAQGTEFGPEVVARGATVLANDGAGRLDGALEVPFDPGRIEQASFPGAVQAVQLRAGEHPDLAVTDNERTFVLLNLGGDAYSSPIDVGPGLVRLATDLDGDTLQDLVLTRADTTWLWRSLGDGHLELWSTFTDGPWIGLADMDGDTQRDLVFRATDSLLAIRRGMPGGFGVIEILDLTFRTETSVIGLADLDSNGLADVVSGLRTSACPSQPDSTAAQDSLVIRFNLDGLHFSEPSVYALPGMDASCPAPKEIVFGDLDRDLLIDIAVLSSESSGSDLNGCLSVFFHTALQTFESQGPIDAGNSPNDLHLVDLNGDGAPEPVTINANGGFTFHFYYRENDGHGVFLPIERHRVNDFPTNLAAADLDGDDRPDIVTYTPRWGSLRIVRNLSIPPAATAVSLSTASVRVIEGRVSLSWHSIPTTDGWVKVYRRDSRSGWNSVASRSATAGWLAFEDRSATPGVRYGYRLGILAGGHEVFAGETWVDVPALRPFTLQGARPNPMAGEPKVAFSLTDAGPVRLELIDIAGRRVRERQWERLGPGDHVVRLNSGPRLAPGVYLLRMSQSGRMQSARVSVLD